MIDNEAVADVPPPQLSDETLNELCRVFKVLGDATRLRIVELVGRHSELNVSELCDLVELSQPLVSHHLALLRTAGVLVKRREGKCNYYAVQRERFAHLMDSLMLDYRRHAPCERFLECMLLG